MIHRARVPCTSHPAAGYLAKWGQAMTLSIGGAACPAQGVFEYNRSFDVEAFASKYRGVTRLSLKAGAVLFAQGEAADCMFYLQAGRIQVSIVSNHGKEAILGVVEPGDFCGEGCLLGRIRIATAACIADSAVVRIERTAIVSAVRYDTQFAEFFLVYALTTIIRLRESLISQHFDSSEKRLARVLLLLANYGKEGAQDNVIKNVDQEALAQMIGTTRSRVNHFMNKFRRLGYIDYNGTIVVKPALLDAVLRESPLTAPEAA